MPIPLDRAYWSTLAYVTGDMTFAAENPELNGAIADIVAIVKGRGLLKARHYPVAVALIRDLIDVMHRDIPSITDRERAAIVELGDAIRWIDAHKTTLPLKSADFPDYEGLTPNPHFPGGSATLVAKLKMHAAVFGGERPDECMKGPLPAPMPGLPPTPPRVR